MGQRPGVHALLLLSPCSPHLPHGPGGTLWSHLLSQARPQQSGIRSGSSLEGMKAQLNSRLSLRTSVLPLPGHTRLQDTVPLESPWTWWSLSLAREAPPIRPQTEAEGKPSARTSTSCSLDLPKAPSSRLHLQSQRGPGQNSDTGSPRGLPWVREGAGRVLGRCGRGGSQSCPSASGGAAWSVREEQVKQWAAETLVALEALHEQGVLCRDLNPRNLLLDQAGRCPGLGEGE